jgi:RES domain-containing protein
VAAVYASEQLPMAALEILVHADPSDLVAAFVSIEIDVPDSALLHIQATSLPSHWRAIPTPSMCQAFGDAYLQAGIYLGLVIPSAVIPECINIVLNPRHSAASSITEIRRLPFAFDPRLYGGQP